MASLLYSQWLLVACLLCMIIHCSQQKEAKERYKRFILKGGHWPKGVVPYLFNKVDESTRVGKDLVGSMAVYEQLTPLRFVPWTAKVTTQLGHPGHLKLEASNDRGWSVLGFYDSKNGQWLTCPVFKTCVHEIGHALGFKHEQSHPDRDQWIRVNKPNLFEYDTWEKRGWSIGEAERSMFDVSSVMLYGPGNPKKLNYDLLFPDLVLESRYFYMFRELCRAYKCSEYPQCKNQKLTCSNEGFVSVVLDKCSCVCPQGLDPDKQCNDVLRKGPSKWPKGTFSLLKHKDGCPDGSFRTGFLRHYGTGENEKTTDSFVGDLSDPKVELSFCTKTTPDSSKDWDKWPLGSYCFFKHGAACPNQRGLYEAKITIPGSKDTSKNSFNGDLPTGTHSGQDSTLEMCCVHTGFTHIPAVLPSEKPFILFASNDCQQVAGMHAKMETFSVFGATVEGDIKYSREGSKKIFHYCVYTPLDRECGGVVNMGPTQQSFTMTSRDNDPAYRECTWLFKSSGKKGTLSFTMDDFNVPSSNTNCVTNVEVQPIRIAQKGIVHCNNSKNASVQSLFGKMLVRFTNGGNPKSSFTAAVQWIPEEDMCYDPKDKGWSYRGKVNYTERYEPCLPWSQTLACNYNSYTVGHYLDGLEENYCRNPDGSFRPWCYTKLEGCKRSFCDVCNLAAFDQADDCAHRKANGLCTVKDVDCAKTCGVPKALEKGTRIQCKPPGWISMGDFQGTPKAMYDLGDKVTFKCKTSPNTVVRTCTGNGEWTAARTACLPCPEGFEHFQNNCYKFIYLFLKYDEAVRECKKHGAIVATPKTIDENNFLSTLRYPYNLIWVGAKIEKGAYKWSDGTTPNWFNWKYSDITHKYPCIFLTIKPPLWRDSTCSYRFNFICQKPVSDANPDCWDFLDNCYSLIRSAPSSDCLNVPGLATYCPRSCRVCPRVPNKVVRVTKASPEYKITAMRTNFVRYSTWIIKAPNKSGRFTLHFDEFQKAEGKECVHTVEVRQSEYGTPYIRYCDANYTGSFVIVNDQIVVRFRTEYSDNKLSSTTPFKATIKWIPDSDMCYDVDDRGWSYNGKVSYTESFKPCLPWSEALNCVNNTLQDGYFLDNLQNNFCRNPDREERPYCYNKDCQKEYCDVCHLKKPYDTSSDCQKFKADPKLCDTDRTNAVKECAETCKSTLQGTKVKVVDVTCSKPGPISMGILPKSVKNSYTVGDKVRYKCEKSDRYVKRTCLASGTWSTAKTACLDCPFGFVPFKNKCYKYFKKYLEKEAAQQHCQKLKAVIAAPKNKEENDFIASLRGNERLWLGGMKETDSFVWNDGTKITWTHWLHATKSFQSREKCIVMERIKDDKKWTDDWCKDKLFHFVCQANRHTDQAECVDFLDVCPSLVNAVPNSDCFPYPSLQMYCRESCQFCSSCNEDVRLTSGNPHYNLVTKVKPGVQFCTWNIQGDDKKGRYAITMDTFALFGTDSFEIKPSLSGEALYTYNGQNYQRVSYVSGQNIVMAFSAKNTNSQIKANVRWIKDSDMCYDVNDKGWSYNGHINYTKNFQQCLPWSQALKCKHNPLIHGDFLDNLKGSYCRNPDQDDRPWCYVKGCQKQHCDVCHLETPKDLANDCAQRKNSGLCTDKDIDCAATCPLVYHKQLTKVSQIKCGPPGPVSGGQLQGVMKGQYNVGEKVVYHCTKNSFPIERVCLSSGQWSVAGTACLACPMGFIFFGGNCYKFINKSVDYKTAVSECQNVNALIAHPKNQQENKFIHSLSQKSGTTSELMWLGAQKNVEKGKFYWVDDTPISWDKFENREPFSGRDNCLLLKLHSWNINKGKWHDDWCHDKAYPFVCQHKGDDNPDCKDFVDNCADLFALNKQRTCDSNIRLKTLCRHTCGVCSRDCKQEIKLTQSQSSYDIVSDRRRHSSRYCTWSFKGDTMNGRFVVQFGDFEVASSGTECVDMVDISPSQYGFIQRYCNKDKKRKTQIINNEMIVRFRTAPTSSSHFRATVKWIDDSSMCYNVKDKGWSYNGKVNYTQTLQPCLPWYQALACPHNPLKEKNFLDNLDGNYCRNPDKSSRPWCYVRRDCEKQYCDVCHLVKLVDTASNCDKFKADGKCVHDPDSARRDCAKTCQVIPKQSAVPKVRDIRCPAPEQMPGAVIQSKQQVTYGVGDSVTYKCSKGPSTVDRTCLSSGEWSKANTACLECPVGWVQFKTKCYRYINQFVEYYDAIYECKKLNSIVATVKSDDVKLFLSKYCPKGDKLWVGLHKNKLTKNWEWSDGEKTEPKWTGGKSKTNDECAVINHSATIAHDWCNNKFFSFLCQVDSHDKPDCVDFVDKCPELIKLKSNNQCDSVLNKFCRKTCGACSMG